MCLEHLVSFGHADVECVTNEKLSLLHAAVLGGHLEVVRYLLYHLDERCFIQQTQDGATVFHIAAGKRRRYWVYMFITCSAVILYADWSIGVRPGAVHTL